jgi:hypothetical protein
MAQVGNQLVTKMKQSERSAENASGRELVESEGTIGPGIRIGHRQGKIDESTSVKNVAPGTPFLTAIRYYEPIKSNLVDNSNQNNLLSWETDCFYADSTL